MTDKPIYRVLRVLEYAGTREFIDHMITNRGVKGQSPGWGGGRHGHGEGIIRESFLGELPELVNQAVDLEKLRVDLIPHDYEIARRKLISLFMDYPGDEEDEEFNELVTEASLPRLIDALTARFNTLKEELHAALTELQSIAENQPAA
jgi:hypothetical protein